MSTRVPRTRAGNTWTESRYWTFIRSGARVLWNKYPVKWQVLKAASRPVPKEAGVRHKTEYQCAKCTEWFKAKEVQVDHKVKCGTLKSYADIGPFFERLLCEADGLQVLCTDCHNKKTQEERNAS
jgi:5-methylcytosine-specific restriction endonuclease McrA